MKLMKKSTTVLLMATSMFLCLGSSGFASAGLAADSEVATQDDLNYSFLYFENGLPTPYKHRRPNSEDNYAARANPDLVVQTGYYSLMLGCDDMQLKGYDALAGSDYLTALHEDVTVLTPAGLTLSVTKDGVEYTCTGATVQTRSAQLVRLIQSNRFVQRFDHLGLIFKDSSGNVLSASGRFEVTAWADRVAFKLDFYGVPNVTETAVTVVSPQSVVHQKLVAGTVAVLAIQPHLDTTVSVPNANDYVTKAYNRSTGRALGVRFDEDEYAFHIDVPSTSIAYMRDFNRVDEFVVEVTNPGSSADNIPLVFDQPTPRASTGTIMMLCEESDGRPIGIPVQISKNWHKTMSTAHMGNWLRGYTMLHLAAGETKRFRLRVIFGYWGGAGAVSHSQLSLIGWNASFLWKWDESALGAWGESCTYDPTLHAGAAFMCDVRPSFTGSAHAWTGNSGGGDNLIYRDSGNAYRHVKRVKTAYHWVGPNMTEVLYSGVTDDDKIRYTYTARAVGTRDYHRRFHGYKYEFLKDVTSPARLVFHQMAADYYEGPEFAHYYVGGTTGLLSSKTATPGGNYYKGTPIPFNDRWLAINDVDWHGANRGIISLSSKLNGSPLPLYLHTYGRWYNNVPRMMFDLSSDSVNNSYAAGDVVEGEVEFIMPPNSNNDYWGGDAELINRLGAYGSTTWKLVNDEFIYNIEMDVTVHEGSLLRNYPLEIQAATSETLLADFTIHGGGVGHVPVVVKGIKPGLALHAQRLTDGIWVPLKTVVVDANNDYQAYLNAEGTMDAVFNIPRPSFDLEESWNIRIVSGSYNYPPTTSSLVPADNATTPFVPTSLVMDFNEPVVADTGSITIQNLSDASQVIIDVTDGTQVSITGNTLTITPTSGFRVDKNYAIQIGSGAITDAAGKPFAGIADNTTWNFTAGNGMVANYSFENPVYGSPGDSGHDHPGWTDLGDNNAGTGRTTAGQFPSGIPDGLNYAWFNAASATLSQTIAVDLQADTTYTLTVATGWRTDLSEGSYPTYPGYGIELWAGGEMVASDYDTGHGGTGVGPVAGTWKEVTATYTSPSSVAPGQALEIRLRGYGIQTDYDNVRLTTGTLPPEIQHVGVTVSGTNSVLVTGLLAGGRSADAWLCWGDYDGGTDRTGDWSHVVHIGRVYENYPFQVPLTNLTSNASYWYRIYATNTAGTVWSDAAHSINIGQSAEHSMQITCTNFTGSGTLTNFPLLVKLTTNNTDHYAGFLDSVNGTDLRFWTNSTLTGTELNYEIDHFDSAGDSRIWVQVPRLTQDTSIWASWGNASHATPPAYTTNGAVWSTDYVGVWHLQDVSEGTTAKDTSSYNNHGTLEDAATGVQPGRIGNGYWCDGDQPNNLSPLTAGNDASLNLTTMTFSGWFDDDAVSEGNGYVAKGKTDVPAAYYNWEIFCDMDGSIRFRGVDATDGENWSIRGGKNTGGWRHVAATWDGTTGADGVKLYLDGAEIASGAAASTTLANDRSLNLGGGAGGTINSTFKGTMDELRLAASAKSADWVWACWMNQGDDHDTFSQYSAPLLQRTIVNEAPSAVSSNDATCNATVNATDTGSVVHVYWGSSDGGTNSTLWAEHAVVGTFTGSVVTVSHPATGLTPGRTYYYTFSASDEAGSVWAAPSWEFRTLGAPVTSSHAVPYAWLADRNENWSANYETNAWADHDDDGFFTWQEYWSGTDPMDSNSFLHINAIKTDGPNIILEWQHAVADPSLPPIRVQTTSNLFYAVWQTVALTPVINGTNTWTNAPSGQLFYRFAVPNTP